MDSIHSISIADLLRSHAASYPDKIASVYRDRRYTWPQLNERTTQLANALKKLGCGEKSRLLWLGQNSDRLYELTLAGAKLGAVVCPANWRLSVEELAGVIEDFAPHAVFWQNEEIGAIIEGARKSYSGNAPWIRVDGELESPANDEYEKLLSGGDKHDDEVFVDPDLPLQQIYTAAFAGKPQGALLSHRAIHLQTLMFAALQDIDASFVFLNSGPMFHVGVWMTTWPTFLMGGTNVFVRRVDAEELCQIIDREKCTGAYTVHSTQEQMVELNKTGKYNLKSLVTHGGSDGWNAMVTLGTARWFKQFSGYGQSETIGLISIGGFSKPGIGTHGRPSPLAVVKIFDDEGKEVPVGETGEIVVRGYTVMNGYHVNGGEPQERTINGWHRTNDLGRREKDGSISFIGPKQRMIKSGVENIYPSELEGCIRKLDGVADAAVIGVPDDRWIQTVKAIVVLKAAGVQDEKSVIEHCKKYLASYKKPSTVVFVASIPKKDVYFNDYDKLDAEFGGGNYPGGNTRSR